MKRQLGLMLAAAAAAAGLCWPPCSAAAGQSGPDARELVEQTLQQITKEPNFLPALFVRSSPRDRLEAEIKRRRDQGAAQEAQLLEDLRLFLYGELELDKCEQVDAPDQFRVQNLRPGSPLDQLVQEAQAVDERERPPGRLRDFVADRRLRQVETCKPIWDRKLQAILGAHLGGQVGAGMARLYENLVAYDAERFPAGEQDAALANYHQFRRLLRKKPKPASLLVYMSRVPESARLLQLDENMKNPNLAVSDYARALQLAVRPVCQPVCEHLKPMGELYKRQVYADKEDENFQARLAKLYHDQPADVTRGLVLEWACCQLLEPTRGGRLLKNLYRQISAKAPTAPGPRRELDFGPDAFDLDFDSAGAEFERRRHKLFMKQNGFKPKRR